MAYRFAKSYPDSLLILPGEVLEKIEEASEKELRILLHAAPLLLSGGAEEEEISTALSGVFPREEVLSALAFWRGCGIVKADGRKTHEAAARRERTEKTPAPPREEESAPAKKFIDADEAPFYSSKDLADAAEARPDFKNLVSFAQERLEKVFNTSELARLYSFLDYLKMPVDVIMLVIEDCVSREKKSLRYITKMLTSFQDEGIDSYEKAEAWFLARRERGLYERHVRDLFGLGERKLTRGEAEMLEKWRKDFGYGEEMLDAAYEKTVASAKTPSMKYMHKILESWYLSGAATPADTLKLAKKPDEGKAPKSYDLDDFFQQAVSKGRKNL